VLANDKQFLFPTRQGKKQTIVCQYPLFKAHLDRCVACNHQIKDCAVTEHNLYS